MSEHKSPSGTRVRVWNADQSKYLGLGTLTRWEPVEIMGFKTESPVIRLETGSEIRGVECWWEPVDVAEPDPPPDQITLIARGPLTQGIFTVRWELNDTEKVTETSITFPEESMRLIGPIIRNDPALRQEWFRQVTQIYKETIREAMKIDIPVVLVDDTDPD